MHLRVLPNLQAKTEVEVTWLSDGAVALRANIITDDAVVADSQSATGKVLQRNGRVRHSHSGPAWSSRNLFVAALGETGAGDLSATCTARFGDTGISRQSGREKGQDGKKRLHYEEWGPSISRGCDR